MENNNKKTLIIGILAVVLIGYYFLFPSRSWIGKPYLETTGNEGFAVVELFTSEGCSSCPAADDLMARIRKESPSKKIYLLAFHVDYWNHLNWKDRFSSVKSSERQKQYASWMGRGLLYTPQFVINGTSEFGGDDQRTLYRIVADALQKKTESILTLHVGVKQDSIIVDHNASSTNQEESLFLALLQKDDSTMVKRGENGGRLLHHVQIVRATALVPIDKKEGAVRFSKPAGFNMKNFEVIGFIQNKHTGVINTAAKAEF